MFHLPETNFKIGFFSLVCMVMAAITSGPAGSCYAQHLYTGKINATRLNVRSAPDPDASVVVVLNKGERVNVLEMSSGAEEWLLVEHQGLKGYIKNRSRYILLKPAPPDPSSPLPAPPPSNSDKGEQVGQAGRTEEARQSRQAAIKRKIREEKRKIKKFSRQETQVLDDLDKIDMALNQARLTARTLKKEADAIAGKIEKTKTQLAALNRSVETLQNYAGKRLNALFRMQMMGRLEMVSSPSSLFDFFITQNALEKVVASDFVLLDKQVRNMKELTRLEQALKSQHKLKSELQDQLKRKIARRKKESRKKATILKQIRRKKRLSLAARTALHASARRLNQTISAIASPAKPRGVKSLGSKIPGIKIVGGETLFSRQKGRLHPPIKGQIISRFGTTRKGDYNAFTFQSGIDIRAQRGTPVKNVFSGEVIFAQWMKGYGNLMIINHGDNYYTLYAHAEELYKKKGERVKTGEIIGTAGDTGSIKGPCLHFEVRHHGKPVDPLKWLKKGA